MANWTRETVLDEARKAKAKVDGALSRNDFCRLTGISIYVIYRLFPDGGWTEIRELVGLPRHPQDNESLDEVALIEEFHRIVEYFGEIPTIPRFNRRASVSYGTIQKRFGGRNALIGQYRNWLTVNRPESRFLESIQLTSKKKSIPSPVAIASTPRKEWAKRDGSVLGPPINFRGLQHAPINEQGVVYLFGMVSAELGFIVETIRQEFPDCEAKRCVDKRNDRWQRVRIEFEFYSSNFKDHNHDPADCDLIVCWEHDWSDCPLEALELRSVIGQLEG